MTERTPEDVALSRRIVLFMAVVLAVLLVSLAYGPAKEMLERM